MICFDKPLLVVAPLLLLTLLIGLYVFHFHRRKIFSSKYTVGKTNNDHSPPLSPTKIALDKLISRVELALSQEIASPPRLFVEQVKDPSRRPFPYIIADINQITYLLVKAILQVADRVNHPNPSPVRMQMHNTFLQFKQTDSDGTNDSSLMLFQATALLISSATIPRESLPKVKHIYDDFMDPTLHEEVDFVGPCIDLQQETISSIVRAHYGYLEYPIDRKQQAMLLVIPIDVTDIMNNIKFKLPIDPFALETRATPKEQTDAMMVLIQFHDHLAQFSDDIDPIDIDIISPLVILLQQHFNFKRHPSGQLFYVRALEIAKLVVEWFFYAPKVIYSSLIYGLVYHNYLSRSYVKDHYSLDVYAIVLNLLGVEKRQELDHFSLVYVENRLEKVMNEDQVRLAVLCIKLAERLYDLGHATNYIDVGELQSMAQETLTIDVNLANEYLGPEIGMRLKKAAKHALKICKNKGKTKDKDNDKDR